MFERGSEWRRWDLHIHTPETKENDQYPGSTPEEKWDMFYEAVNQYLRDESNPLHNIVVIGITDYLSVDNYLKVLHDNRLPSSVKLILPNVELRVSISSKKTPVNLHCIFDPEIVEDLNDLFFSKLGMVMADGRISASKSDLIRLGKMIDATLDEHSALATGIRRFRPPIDEIFKLFKSNDYLREHVLIGVPNGTNDGLSGMDDSFSFIRENIYKVADFIFSSNPSDRDYFLGKKASDSPETIKKKYGSLMPCIHGCDAHCIEKIFEPDKKRYCWIKADPTFNGLKQILCEPESRVRISSEKPEEKNPYQIIDYVRFNDERFPSNPIVFNEELNCIIGGKSTGKSLLLHNIAKTIDKKQVEDKINACGLNETLELSNMEVVWKDGKIDKDGKSNDHKIFYIPQTYLNRLSEEKEEKTEIDHIIEDVLLQNDDIKTAHEDMNLTIQQLKQSYTKLCLDIINNYNYIVYLNDEIKKSGNSEAIKQNIEQLKNKQKEFSKSESITNEALEEYQLMQSQVKQDESDKEILNYFSNCIENTIEIIDKDRINALKNVIDISSVGDSKLLDEVIGQIDEAYESIYSYSKEVWGRTIKDIQAIIQKKISIINKNLDTNKEKIKNIAGMINDNENFIDISKRINAEENTLERVFELESKLAEKTGEYNSQCIDLAQAFDNFKAAHEKYAQTVNQNQEIKSTGLTFYVQTFFRETQFCEAINRIFDKRILKSKKNIIDVESFELGHFTSEKKIKFIQECVQNELKTVKNEDVESALRNLFTDWFNTNYTIKMENDSLQQMSPGKKSLVLLELIISLANSKYPILIDQPEDDLDNRSIFNELIPYIKEKKKERQFIIVTHNANVVLGGDAEEVIVANQDGDNSPNEKSRFEYLSGSIENNMPIDENSNGILKKSGIQQHICDVLEGGKVAFELRTKKYRI